MDIEEVDFESCIGLRIIRITGCGPVATCRGTEQPNTGDHIFTKFYPDKIIQIVMTHSELMGIHKKIIEAHDSNLLKGDPDEFMIDAWLELHPEVKRRYLPRAEAYTGDGNPLT
jgi:hypothetical protein